MHSMTSWLRVTLAAESTSLPPPRAAGLSAEEVAAAVEELAASKLERPKRLGEVAGGPDHLRHPLLHPPGPPPHPTPACLGLRGVLPPACPSACMLLLPVTAAHVGACGCLPAAHVAAWTASCCLRLPACCRNLACSTRGVTARTGTTPLCRAQTPPPSPPHLAGGTALRALSLQQVVEFAERELGTHECRGTLRMRPPLHPPTIPTPTAASESSTAAEPQAPAAAADAADATAASAAGAADAACSWHFDSRCCCGTPGFLVCCSS